MPRYWVSFSIWPLRSHRSNSGAGSAALALPRIVRARYATTALILKIDNFIVMPCLYSNRHCYSAGVRTGDFGAGDSAATELSVTVICNTHQDFNFRYAANDRLPFFQRLLPERCPGIVSNPHSDLTPSSSSIFPGSVVGSLQLYLTQTYAVAFPWIADW